MEIGRELDRIQPEPALYPADPELRAKVEEAEAWGDEFQQKPRRFSWWAFKQNRPPMASYSEGARLGVPVGLAVKTGGPLVAVAARLNDSTDANVSADLSSLRADLDRIDAWIADGVIGGPQPNAADYQIAPSLRLLMSFDDLRPFIEGRPCGEMAMRVVPEFPGRTPQIFPADWLAGLAAKAGGGGSPFRSNTLTSRRSNNSSEGPGAASGVRGTGRERSGPQRLQQVGHLDGDLGRLLALVLVVPGPGQGLFLVLPGEDAEDDRDAGVELDASEAGGALARDQVEGPGLALDDRAEGDDGSKTSRSTRRQHRRIAVDRPRMLWVGRVMWSLTSAVGFALSTRGRDGCRPQSRSIYAAWVGGDSRARRSQA